MRSGRVSADPMGRTGPISSVCAPTGCSTPTSVIAPRTSRRARASSSSTPRRSRLRTWSVWRRASAGSPRVPALSSWPSSARSTARSRCDWRGDEVTLAVAGAHNALDAAGALEAARLAGADATSAIAGLAGFGGAGRRFQPLGSSPRGALVFDDYAHHPTEVAATPEGARTLGHSRLGAVFQPHLYSRTASLAHDFGVALARADVVVVLD